jgi:subfamily B ATP-binding cassette protein MsbA
MTPGEFFSFVAGLAMLYEPIRKLNNANNSVQTALAGAERVFELLDSPGYIPESGGSFELAEEFEELRFKNVSFAYHGDAQALRNINLTLRRGERLALVGPSGAGKSTFVSLLPRFYDPVSGRITLNGRDLRDYTLPSLRQSMSIVSQDNFLFACSVYDNIAYGRTGPCPEDLGKTEERVMAAAKAAYAHDFIMQMPEGYATPIGERGVKLSGGQKQRITIARAIAKDAPILILDEATSSLDSEAEKIVQLALENLMRGRTSIIIAHRLSTVLASDRILVMNKGEIAAEGPHSLLLETSPLYAKLYKMQFGAHGPA